MRHRTFPQTTVAVTRLTWKRSVLGLLVLGLSSAGQAAQFCVSSDTGLYSALLTASASVDDDEIRLVKGSFNVNFDFGSSGKITGDLALRGGYEEGCATRLSAAAMTRLKAQGQGFRLFPRQASDLTIERIDFDGFRSINIVDNIAEPAGRYGLVLVSRSAFRNAQMGLDVTLLRHDAHIENSLFVDNKALPTSRGLFLETFHNPGTGQTPIASVINCTLRNNSVGLTLGEGTTGAASAPTLIANTIASENSQTDIELFRPTELRYSLYSTLVLGPSGTLAASSTNNLRSPAMLDPSHRSLPGSRAINSGENSFFPTPLKARDYYGNARITNVVIDRGAVESNW